MLRIILSFILIFTYTTSSTFATNADEDLREPVLGPARYCEDVYFPGIPISLRMFVSKRRTMLEGLHTLKLKQAYAELPDLMIEYERNYDIWQKAIFNSLVTNATQTFEIPPYVRKYFLFHEASKTRICEAGSIQELIENFKQYPMEDLPTREFQLRALIFTLCQKTFCRLLDIATAYIVLDEGKEHFAFDSELMINTGLAEIETASRDNSKWMAKFRVRNYFLPIFGDKPPQFLHTFIPTAKGKMLFDFCLDDSALDPLIQAVPELEKRLVLANHCALHSSRRVILAGFIQEVWADYYKRQQNVEAMATVQPKTGAGKKNKGKKKKNGSGAKPLTLQPVINERELEIPGWMAEFQDLLKAFLKPATGREQDEFIQALESAYQKKPVNILSKDDPIVVQQLLKWEQEYATLNAKHKVLEEITLPEKEKEIASLKSQIDSITKSHQASLKSKDLLHEQIKVKLATKESDLAEARESLSAAESQLADLGKQIRSLNKDLSSTKAELERSREIVNSLKTKAQQKEAEAEKALKDAEDRLTAERKQRTTENKRKAAIKSGLEKELDEAKQEKGQLQQQLDKTSQLHKKALEENQQLTRQNEDLIQAKSRLQQEFDHNLVAAQEKPPASADELTSRIAPETLTREGLVRVVSELTADLRAGQKVNERLSETGEEKNLIIEQLRQQLAISEALRAQANNQALQWAQAYQTLAHGMPAQGIPAEMGIRILPIEGHGAEQETAQDK
jgi:hypothetical protein